MHLLSRICFVSLVAFGAGANAATPASAVSPATASAHDGAHDFDFLFGQWTGAQRKLKVRLANSNDWFDFSSTSTARPLLGGRANMDEVVLNYPTGAGAAGATFRVYDPQKQLWSIYWIGTTSFTVDSPVVGRFVNGVGEFYGDDTWEGKPIRVRFIWSKIDLTHAHWEQAFSADAGKTWETNWTADFTRRTF
jgi:hypothetical protein